MRLSPRVWEPRAACSIGSIPSWFISYQLAIEATPADRVDQGRVRRLDVEVRRPGVTVKGRREVILSSRPQPVARPVDVLAEPTDMLEAPLAAATYTTRGDEASTLKVIVLVELLQPGGAGAAPSYAFFIEKDGVNAFETADALTPTEVGARAVVAAQLEPGRYRLRTAIVDAEGKRGSLEVPVAVALRQAGSFQVTDLIVGGGGEPFSPATHVHSGPLVGLLELYTTEPGEFAALAVDLETRRYGTTEIIERTPATVRTTSLERRRIARGQLTTNDLVPGAYVVSAVLRRGAEPIGRVSRSIVVQPRGTR
jgi:hypothetical protein